MDSCHILDWDSNHFDYKIAKTDLHRLTDNSAHSLISWCYENGVDCLYFLADADDIETVTVAESYNFHFIDVRVTLGRDLIKCNFIPAGNIRLAQPEDISILRDLVTFSDSRFYYDTHLRSKADNLFRIWIEKSCDGYADAVFVAEVGGQIAGYVTVKNDEIILMAASDKFRRQGIASSLCRHALYYLKSKGYESMTVATQGRNIPTQAMYQRNGLVTVKTQLYFHWWGR